MFIDDRIAILYTTSVCTDHNVAVKKEDRVGAWAYSFSDIPKDTDIKDHVYIAAQEAEVFSGIGIPDSYRAKYHDTDKALEILAAINAIKDVWKQGYLRAIVYTDSKYVFDGITKFIHGWRRNNWITNRRAMAGPGGRELKNKYLWIDLYSLAYGKGIHVTVDHVRRDSGIPNNNLIVDVARQTIKNHMQDH